MGYSTDFVGHIRLDPPLNTAETDYLRAFSHTRRWDRPAGPYVVLDHPMADDRHDDVDAFNRPAVGEPGLWCAWVPCLDGHCLAHDGTEKAYDMSPWLRYLIATFLGPAATASRSGVPLFDGFTFDHHCDGVVAAARRDNLELSLIIVSDNRVEEVVLVPGEPAAPWVAALPYTADLDLAAQRRSARRAAWSRTRRSLPEAPPRPGRS